MIEFNDAPFVPCNDCANWESCQEEAYKQGKADGYSQAENDYHKQISKDLQSSYDLGCITTLEKIIKLAHEDVVTGNMIISLVDVEKLKDNDVQEHLCGIEDVLGIKGKVYDR